MSEQLLERETRLTTGVFCGACGKQLDESMNDEECPKSMYWHRRHDRAVFPSRCCE